MTDRQHTENALEEDSVLDPMTVPGSRRDRKEGRKNFSVQILAAALLVIAVVAVGVPVFIAVRSAKAKPQHATWGVTFSQKQSRDYGLDWRANYKAIVTQLKPHTIRVCAYWDLIEPEPGKFDFRDLDWQMDQAEKADIPVVLAVGQKVPRWPELHVPTWINVKRAEWRERELMIYMAKIVERYKGRKNLLYWQVENEPYVPFGHGMTFDYDFLKKEIEYVRITDPAHKIVQTDSGEWGDWTRAASNADIFGTTLYRRTWSPKWGQVIPKRTPEYYAEQADATRKKLNRPDMKFICAELQAEPWGPTLNTRMSIDKQIGYFPPGTFDETIQYARDTGYDTFYLWGVEWWYYLMQHGHGEYWTRAWHLMREK